MAREFSAEEINELLEWVEKLKERSEKLGSQQILFYKNICGSRWSDIPSEEDFFSEMNEADNSVFESLIDDLKATVRWTIMMEYVDKMAELRQENADLRDRLEKMETGERERELPLTYNELLQMDGQAVYTWDGTCYIVNAKHKLGYDKWGGYRSLSALAGKVHDHKLPR